VFEDPIVLATLCESLSSDSVGAVCMATGPLGPAMIAVYSFLNAFVLPFPSEVVLLAPLNLGLPYWATLLLIVLVSGLGKAAGSVFAFHIGQEATVGAGEPVSPAVVVRRGRAVREQDHPARPPVRLRRAGACAGGVRRDGRGIRRDDRRGPLRLGDGDDSK